jgi:hypothetical protein
MLDAVRQLTDDRAVPAVATVMKRKKFFGGKKARAFKTASVQALIAIGSPGAAKALADAAARGDRILKQVVRRVQR